jgi:TctA family transporter
MEPYLLGIAMGLISGLIPGVGNFVLLLLAWPFLYNFDVMELLIIYVSMASISQFIGSIPAIVFGIPGESSSFPAVQESKRLTTIEEVSKSISGSAFGSAFGGIFVAGLCFYFVQYLELIKHFYSTKLLVGLLLSVCIVMVLTIDNRWWVNLLLIMSGLLLGSIGYNSYLNTEFLTFGVNSLWSGLPLTVVLICLFAIPQILNNINFDVKKLGNSFKIGKVYILNPIYLFFSTVIGFFGGLVPGLTTVFSSISAYSVSLLFTRDPVKRIVVSETANNAGAFSMLLPLLLFGIPIIGSEAILLFLMEQKGFSIVSWDFTNSLKELSISLIYINLIGLCIAWPLSKFVTLFYKINLNALMYVILASLFFVTLYTGHINYNMSYYFICFILLAPIGAFLKNVNTLPLVFAFIVHDKLIDSIYRLSQIIGV